MGLGLWLTKEDILVDVSLDGGPEGLALILISWLLALICISLNLLGVLRLLYLWPGICIVWEAFNYSRISGWLDLVVACLLLNVLLDFHLKLHFLLVVLFSWHDDWVGGRYSQAVVNLLYERKVTIWFDSKSMVTYSGSIKMLHVGVEGLVLLGSHLRSIKSTCRHWHLIRVIVNTCLIVVVVTFDHFEIIFSAFLNLQNQI